MSQSTSPLKQFLESVGEAEVDFEVVRIRVPKDKEVSDVVSEIDEIIQPLKEKFTFSLGIVGSTIQVIVDSI